MTMAFDEKTFVPTPRTNWTTICSKNFLSEEFITKWVEYVDWEQVCLCQKLSRSFILNRFLHHLDHRLYFGSLQKNRHLSEELKREIEMWGSMKLMDVDDFHDFREKIEDRMNAV